MATKNINVAKQRQPTLKTADVSKDAAGVTCSSKVTLSRELMGFRGLLQPSVHAKANQSHRFLKRSLFAHPFV